MATSDTLDWDVPSDADVGYTYARFRFTLTGTEAPGGAGSDGEVEDYILYTLAPEDLTSSDDTGDANPGDGICADTFGACTVRAAIMEANASGLPLFIDAGALGKSGRATLQPQSPYPAITGAILLNGDGTLEIDGSQAGADANGFVLEGSGSWIVSTNINSFDGDGIRITGSNNVTFNNRIHDNGGAGVNIVSGTGNVVFSSALFANGGLGIDLGDDGVTANDTDDSDDGANGLQNHPDLSLAMADESRIEGSLSSTPNGLFTIDFYASAACDPSSSGEGARYLGSTEIETDNLGMASFSLIVDESGFAAGESVTATATNLTTGDANRGSTSEFSSCETATATAIERNPDAEVPLGHQLFQNYPNPFNPTTHIRFAITQREWVRIEVYDILGKRVATLVDGYVDAGEFTVEFDGRDLPSGIYLYRMSAGSYAAAKQLTLLK
jgi:hypothetical protein